jgi:hypothetical protein
MASPHHRHQSSLEAILNFSPTPPLPLGQRIQGKDVLMKLLAYYRQSSASPSPNSKPKPYRPADLLELVHEHAVSDLGRDNVLRYLLSSLLDGEVELQAGLNDLSDALALLADFDSWNEPRKTRIVAQIEVIAEHLINRFFLPRKNFHSLFDHARN